MAGYLPLFFTIREDKFSSMIPQRIELRTYPYQKHALPIKLRNLRKPPPGVRNNKKHSDIKYRLNLTLKIIGCAGFYFFFGFLRSLASQKKKESQGYLNFKVRRYSLTIKHTLFLV